MLSEPFSSTASSTLAIRACAFAQLADEQAIVWPRPVVKPAGSDGPPLAGSDCGSSSVSDPKPPPPTALSCGVEPEDRPAVDSSGSLPPGGRVVERSAVVDDGVPTFACGRFEDEEAGVKSCWLP